MLRPKTTKQKPDSSKRDTPLADSIYPIEKPPLDPLRIFSRQEAAWAVGVAEITLLRETKKGRLSYYKRGRRVFHSGQHLLDWLQQGERKAWKTERW
jgi:hypothetical protein